MIDSPPGAPSSTPPVTITQQLLNDYHPLPEERIAISADRTVYAQYAGPTDRYPHGILGDIIEASQLVVVVDSQFFELTLPDAYVFEDIQPRLYDVNLDGKLEIITIRSHRNRGAGIAIYEWANEALKEYAFVQEIGIPNRWLNPAVIYDLDHNGKVEIAWV